MTQAGGKESSVSGELRGQMCFTWLRPGTLLASLLVATVVLAASTCERKETGPQTEVPFTSTVMVAVPSAGPLTVRTRAAEFEISPSGYIRASLIRNGKTATLDDAQGDVVSSGSYPVVDGKRVEDFVLDLSHPKILNDRSRIGSRGKRIEITGASSSYRNLEERLTVNQSVLSARRRSSTLYIALWHRGWSSGKQPQSSKMGSPDGYGKPRWHQPGEAH